MNLHHMSGNMKLPHMTGNMKLPHMTGNMNLPHMLWILNMPNQVGVLNIPSYLNGGLNILANLAGIMSQPHMNLCHLYLKVGSINLI
jgi:hypothetical protein